MNNHQTVMHPTATALGVLQLWETKWKKTGEIT